MSKIAKKPAKRTQIERQITILYRWWRDDEEEVLSEHLPDLEEHAVERINEMRQQGYTSGELCFMFVNHERFSTTEYSGWWEMTTKTT